MTTEEVAKFFRRSPRTIHDWKRRGLMRPIEHTRPALYNNSEIQRRMNQLKPTKVY